MAHWTFLTNHARVLLCVAQNPDVRLRTLANCAQLTERAVFRIICDLEEAGYLTRHRLGRRNFYEVNLDRPLGDPVHDGHQLGDVLGPLLRCHEGAHSSAT